MLGFFFFLSISTVLASPRIPLPQMELRIPPEGKPFRLTLKFKDAALMRVDSMGRLKGDDESLTLWALQNGVSFKPLIAISSAKLAMLEARVEKWSGKSQPDFGGMMIAQRHSQSPLNYMDIATHLERSPLVEYVYFESLAPPPPVDIPPLTPDFSSNQDWQGLPNGLNIQAFWSAQIRGQSIVVGDIEYGVDHAHEDLMDQEIAFEENQTISDFVYDYGYEQHGTSVLGMTSAGDNGYGVTGVLSDADVWFFPEWSDEEESRRATAILSAISTLSPGDILMLEMQAYGDPDCGWEFNCFVPAEIDPNVWAATRSAVDAGIVVVAAAGNGDQNLDHQWYLNNYLNRGDSGAIIVGGGTVDHDYFGLTYGSRIDFQGWALHIYTLGYSTLAELDHHPLQTYGDFGGTSGATPMVASVAGLLQDWAKQNLGFPIPPSEAKQLMLDTATPSISSVPIGPFPNAGALYERITGPVFDLDADGFVDVKYGGQDCDDGDSEVFPGASDIPYDDIDSDCAGDSDFDADGDGFDSVDYGGSDCDDADSHVFPGAEDEPYDGIDSDCVGDSDYDADGDGYDSIDYFGDDCADDDSSRHPSAYDMPYDGVDSDCSGGSDYDADGDGYDSDAYSGADCDDRNSDIHPMAEDVPEDGLDQDCDGADSKWLGCAAVPLFPQTPLFMMLLSLVAWRRRQLSK